MAAKAMSIRLDPKIRAGVEEYAKQIDRSVSTTINYLCFIAMKGDINAVQEVHANLANPRVAVKEAVGKATATDQDATGYRTGPASDQLS